MLKLLELRGLFEPLKQFGRTKPIFGTCAGRILAGPRCLHPRQAVAGADGL